MSFSSEQKKRITLETYKNSCCRRALLCGILSAKAIVSGSDITINLEKKEFCDFFSKLVNEFFGVEPVISTNKNGGRCRNVSFRSKAASKYLRSLENDGDLFTEKCQGCSASYLKGVFLASGTISDPQKQYLLEFSPSYNVDNILNYLTECSFSPKMTSRRG